MRVIVLLNEVVKTLDTFAHKVGLTSEARLFAARKCWGHFNTLAACTATPPCSCHVYGRLKIIPIHFVNYYDVIRGLARKNDSQFDNKQCVCESNIEMNHRFLLTRYILHK